MAESNFVGFVPHAGGTENELLDEYREIGFSTFCCLYYIAHKEKTGSGTFAGVIIDTDNAGKALKTIRELRHDVDFLAVRSEKRDVLSECVVASGGMLDAIVPNFQKTGVSADLAKVCAREGVALFFEFSQILKASAGGLRFLVIRRMSEAVSHMQTKKDARIIISCSTSTPLLLRSPRELKAFFQEIGMRDVVALAALSRTPQEILESNRARRGQPAFGVCEVGGGE